MKTITQYLSSILIFACCTVSAQNSVLDTTQRAARTDTTLHSSIDTVVNYAAKDSIIYSLQTRFMYLYSNSELKYQTINLKAERVDVNWDNALLTAHGIPDTAKADSIIGKPILHDGGDEYHGDKVDYNFRTRKGKITVGTTQMENGYYVGEEIKKVETDELFIANGTYTTCDLPHPHFYFESPEMKVYVRDIVVAEPVYFYVSDVPVFALPFGVFPSHGGRTSGIIAPAYGQDDTYGWYLGHLGYYWAASDYWDIATMLDLYARGKWMSQTNINYALRYNLSGGITARITSLSTGETSDPQHTERRDYFVNLRHNQTISPSSHLDVDFTFASSTYFKNFSTNINDILQQNILSNATFWKTWDQSNRSLTVDISRDQNLITNDVHQQLPSVSFSQGQIYPFRKKTKTRGLTTDAESEQNILDMIGFNYSANFTNDQKKESKTFDSAYTQSGWQKGVIDFQQINTKTFSQGLSFGISPKVGYFTVSPSVSWNETRTYLNGTQPIKSDSTIISHDTSNWQTAGNVSAGVSTSTRFYGIFQPNMLGIIAFRQTVTPSLSMTYSKKIYGGILPKYSMTGAFNMGNNFEMKTQKNDSARTENKIQLGNIGTGVSYNFAADSMNFSEINVSYRTDIGTILSVSGNATYNLYEFDPRAYGGTGARVNRFLINHSNTLADLTGFSLALSTSLRGEKKQATSSLGIPQDVQQEQDRVDNKNMQQASQKKIYQNIFDKEEADFSIPWNISLSYSFSQSQSNPHVKTRSSSVNAGLSFNLTDKWQISTHGSYDFVTKEKYIQSIDVTRDLHCWQMSFTYYPTGTLSGYRFELRVKAPQLQDIKITKQSTRPY